MPRNKSKKTPVRNNKRPNVKKNKTQQRVFVPKKSPNKNKKLLRRSKPGILSKVKKSVSHGKQTGKTNKNIRKGSKLKSTFEKLNIFSREKKADKILFFMIVFLVLAGLLMVLDTSLVFAKRDFKNAYHFLILQTIYALVGFGAFLFCYFINYKVIKKFIFPFYIITILLLIMTLFTKEVNGARSWLSLGGFNLQPSELAKLTFVLYISGILAKPRKWKTTSEFIKDDFLPFAIPLLGILFFVLAGKDLGTSIIIASVALFIYFFKSKTRVEYITCAIMLIVFAFGAVGMVALEGYRGDRVKVYLNALTQDKIVDEQGSGYQMKQILLALGSGGLTGVGLAESLQKYDLVETTAATDSVIAIIAEEFGFIGAVTTLGIFLVFIYRGLTIIKFNQDSYGQIVAVGIVSWIGMQVFIHVASNVVVTPLTGVPLPFLSYGGSSLMSCMIASGILLNISKR